MNERTNEHQAGNQEYPLLANIPITQATATTFDDNKLAQAQLCTHNVTA